MLLQWWTVEVDHLEVAPFVFVVIVHFVVISGAAIAVFNVDVPLKKWETKMFK